MLEIKDVDVVAKEIEKEGTIVVNEVRNIEIRTKEEYAYWGERLKEAKAKLREIEKQRKSFVDPLNQTVKKINAVFKKASGPINEAVKIIERGIREYLAEIERKKREEEERLKKEAEARRKRLEAFARKAEERGDLEKAEELREKAEDISVAPVSVKEEAVVEGLHTRKNWKWRVIDEKKVAENAKKLFEMKVLVLDEKKLNQMAKALKDGGNAIYREMGIEFYEEKVIVAKGDK